MYSKEKNKGGIPMSTFKIRLVTAPNQDTFYRRMNVPRESYVDITETNRVQLKHGGNKWKAHLSASDPNYIKEKQDLISGLVFNSRKDAEIFMKSRQKALEKLAKTNPTYNRYEIFTVSKRFLPSSERLNYWKPQK